MLQEEHVDFQKFFKPTDDRRIFLYRHGHGYVKRSAPPCQWKLCITATDEEYLAKLLYSISGRDDCYFVKYSPKNSPKSRDGMMLGRVFMTTEEKLGNLWRDLYSDSKIMCSIQDDEATDKYRSK